MNAPIAPAPLSPTLLESFERDGYLVVRGLYSSEETAYIRDSFMQENRNGPVEGLSQIPQSFSKDDPLSFYPRMMNPHRHPDKQVGLVALEYLLAPASRVSSGIYWARSRWQPRLCSTSSPPVRGVRNCIRTTSTCGFLPEPALRRGWP